MDHIFEIRISGSNDVGALSKENFDIRDLNMVIENLISFSNSTALKGHITLSGVEDGSAKLLFASSLAISATLASVFKNIERNPNLDKIEPEYAEIIEAFQKSSLKKGYSFTFFVENSEFTISPQTNYTRQNSAWLPAEFYFYGELRDAGGGDKVNIHLTTQEYGNLTIDADEDMLKKIPDNILFRNYEIHASGLQNIYTGEIDKKSLKLIGMRPFSGKYDEEEMKRIWGSVGDKWKGIDVDEYISKLRGYE